MRGLLVRSLAVLTVLLGAHYLTWRWLESVHWAAWWIAVPLVLAETWLVVDAAFFGLVVSRRGRRSEPGPPPPGATADVVVTTGDAPPDVVRRTAVAARAVRGAHRTWLADDQERPDLGPLVAEQDLGLLPPAGQGAVADTAPAPRGEFLLLLEAGQIPEPGVLDRTLGWFRDPVVDFVQLSRDTAGDPPGSCGRALRGDAPEAVLRGRDGWGGALFDGAPAVLRRAALERAGGPGRHRTLERELRRSLARTRSALRRARRCPQATDHLVSGMLDDVEAAVRWTRAELRNGAAAAGLVPRLQQEVDAAARRTVTQDFAQIQADLAAIAALELPSEAGMVWPEELASAVDRMSRRDLSPLAAVEPVRQVLEAVALPGPPSGRVTAEALSAEAGVLTSVRLQRQGRRGVHHDELLVHGPARGNLGCLLAGCRTERTVRALLEENPLRGRGLRPGQRLVHLAQLWGCFGGFAAAVWFAVPAAHLVLGVLPVTELSRDLVLRLVPFLVAQQLLLALGGGDSAWRAQACRLALFPDRVRACAAALRRAPGGARQRAGHRLRPQLVLVVLLIAALAAGAARLVAGTAEPWTTAVAAAWTGVNLLALGALVRTAGHQRLRARERTGDAVHG
ncbi:cellulose synthase [Kocuria sp. M1R5S2]|uniref:cellulose synthase n=1 Tax=Kocuria rhizosphaerae TaxID=3376285 RepID=UPI0037A86FB4